MKPIKMFGLAAITALMAMAFAGAGMAMAESTALCDIDPGTGSEEACPSGHLVTHVHEATLSGKKAEFLTPMVTIKCSVLFLGDAVTSLDAPLLITGKFTYTNCNNFCAIVEENGPAVIEVLKLGHETAEVLVYVLVKVQCLPFGGGCFFAGEALQGIAKGPLLSDEDNGEVSLQGQAWGDVCGEGAFLDIVTTPLSATYITN